MTARPAAFPVLAGGRAVARHRYELRREAARLNFSRRASAWIRELLGTSPTLSTEFCYGQCLPELVAGFRALVDSRAEVRPGFRGIGERRDEGRVVREKPGDGQFLSELSASFSSPAGSRDEARHSLRPSPSRPSETGRISDWNDVYQGPLRAEAKLLRRLSGEFEPSQTATAPQPLRSFSPDDARDQELPSFLRSAAFEKKWRGDIAERAAAVLRRDIGDPQALPSHEQITPRGARQRPAPGITPGEAGESRVLAAESSSVADQWSMDLHGQTAPADLLARLTSGDFAGDEEVRRTGLSSQPGSAGAEPPLEMPEPPRSTDMAGTSAALGFGEDAVRKTGAQFTPGLARSRERDAGFPDSILAGTENIPLTPSLPAMLVSQSTDHPEPNVAAAIVRQSLRMDEIHPAESPEALAERIRHILQEEARRHGIDV